MIIYKFINVSLIIIIIRMKVINKKIHKIYNETMSILAKAINYNT
jgi:hypothetical protein